MPSLPDPTGFLGQLLGDQLTAAVTGLLRHLAQDFLTQLAAPVARYVLHTPDLAAEPTLTHLWSVSLAAALACAGLFVAVSGLAIITGRSSRLGQSARLAVAVRLPGCLLAAAVSLPLVGLEVDLANRLVDAFLDTGLSGSAALPVAGALGRALTGDPGAGLAVVVTAAVGVVLLVGLVVVGLARWATLWLLVVLAPLAMGFALLPGGETVARLWWRLQIATVFLPVANAVLLSTYVAMFGSTTTGLVGALSGIAVLALLGRLPSWLAGTAVSVEGAEVLRRVRHGTRAARAVAARSAGPTGLIATAPAAGMAAAAAGSPSGFPRPAPPVERQSHP